MENNVSIPEQRLDEKDQLSFEVLLDLIIPESKDGKMPSAKEVGFWEFLGEYEPRLLDEIPQLLNSLNALSREAHSLDFAGLTHHLKKEIIEKFLLSDAEIINPLLDSLMECYYTNPRVLRGIGQREKPPFPDGYTVEKGNLSLLEPVMKRGKFFRTV